MCAPSSTTPPPSPLAQKQPAGSPPSVLKCKLLYLFLFSGFGVFAPLMSLLYRSYGMTPELIGSLSIISPVVSFVFAPILCATADKMQIQKPMLLSCLVLWFIFQSLVLSSKPSVVQAAVCLLTSISSCPIGSLVDAAVMTSLTDKSQYGSLRLYGAVGFGAMSYIAGILLDSALGWIGVMAAFVLVGIATVAISTSFNIESRHEAESPRICEALKLLSRVTETRFLCIVIVLSGTASGIIDTFLFVRLYDLGARGLCMGLARAVMCAAEVPLFHLSGRIIQRVGVKPVIASCQAAYVVRFLYYTQLTAPWWVLPSEVLHGLTFGLMWASITHYASDIAPPGLNSTVQGVFSGLHWGLGAGSGAFFGGLLYGSLGAVRTFACGAVLSTVSLALVCVAIAHGGGYLSCSSSKRSSSSSRRCCGRQLRDTDEQSVTDAESGAELTAFMSAADTPTAASGTPLGESEQSALWGEQAIAV